MHCHFRIMGNSDKHTVLSTPSSAFIPVGNQTRSLPVATSSPDPRLLEQRGHVPWLGWGWGANREAGRTSDLTPTLSFSELSIFLSLGFPSGKCRQQHLLSHIGSYGLEKQALLPAFSNFLKRL